MLVALGRIVSNSKSLFLSSCVCVFHLPASSLTKSSLSFISGWPQIELTLVFSGCGAQILRIIGVSGVEYGPVSGT